MKIKNNSAFKKLRRATSYLLIAAMIVGVLTVTFTQDSTATENKSDSDMPIKQLTVFKELGIINIDIASDFGGNGPITRAAFADMTAKAIKISNDEKIRIFSDVPSDYRAAASINGLYNMGIIDPAADGKFNPETNITYEQVCKIVVAAAGYNRIAAFEGSKMQNYVTTAYKLGISIKGISPTDEVTFNQAVEMLYNGMFADVFTELSNGTGSTNKDETLFSLYWNIYEGEGVLEATYGQTLEDSYELEKNQAVVNKTKYTLESSADATDKFGENCKIVYMQPKNANTAEERKIYYIEKSNDKTVSILGENINGFDEAASAIEYFRDNNNDKTAKVNIPKNIDVIYNGKPSDVNIAEIINEFSDKSIRGEIKLINNNTEKGYNRMIVWAYNIFKVTSYDPNQEMLYNEYTTGKLKSIDINKKEALRIYNQNGIETELKTTFGSLMTIAQSEDGEYMLAYTCENKKTGVVKTVYKDDKKVVLESGEEIKFDNYIWSNNDIGGSLGAEISVFVDKYGFGIDVSKGAADGYITAYLKQAAIIDNAFDKSISLKLFTAGGEHKTIELNDRVSIDGVKYQSDNYKGICKAFPGSEGIRIPDSGIVELERQLIRIKLNSGEKITDIDTRFVGSNEERESTLTRSHNGDWLFNNTNIKRFGNDILYSMNDTKFFAVPNTDNNGQVTVDGIKIDEEEYMYGIGYDACGFTWDKGYPIQTFDWSDSSAYVDAIVYKTEAVQREKVAYMLVNKGEMYNDEKEQVMNYVEGISSNGAVVKTAVDDAVLKAYSDLEEGDIYELYTDSTGKKVSKIKKIYDRGTHKFNNNDKYEYWYDGSGAFDINGGWNFRNTGINLSKTYLYDVKHNAMKGTYKQEDLSIDIVNEVTPIGGSVIVYDSTKDSDRVHKGDFGEADAYRISGNASVVLTCFTGSYLKAFFVYK